jgi:hypothetical protein
MLSAVISCDRCGHEVRGAGNPRWADLEAAGWAYEWPTVLVPLHRSYDVANESPRHICPVCLTDAERERIGEMRRVEQPF